MEAKDILGKWNGSETIDAEGNVKKHRFSVAKVEFVEGGIGHMKLAIFSFDIKWELNGDKVSFINASDGASHEGTVEGDRIIMANPDGSKAVFVRA